MKTYIVARLVAGVLLIGCVLVASPEARHTHIERAVVRFNEPTKLAGVTLRGEYLFLHHEGMMAQGKPCTYVYTIGGEKEGRFVVSFHCQPVKRDRADQFKVIATRANPYDLPEIHEVQFAGSMEGHLVPQQ
jgi:hypothetical protein